MIKITPFKKHEASIIFPKSDRYTNHINDNYKNFFANSAKESDFLMLLRNSVIEPIKEQIDVLKDTEIKINESLKSLKMNLDIDMGLIFTDGTDNIGEPYTKGFDMVFPTGCDDKNNVLGHLNPHLIVHELWHIISRNNPDLRKAAYKSIGFEETDTPLEMKNGFQEIIADKYFTNPDAINHDHFFKYEDADNVFELYPILTWGGEFLDAELAIVYEKEIIGLEKLDNNAFYTHSFKNVAYNIHPDEICAEHFRYMCMNKHEPIIKDLPDQKMMTNFKNTLSSFLNPKTTNKKKIRP
jgi:hypothetical protein